MPPTPAPPFRRRRCRAFNEAYLPWLNDLPPPRLETEFFTLRGYLTLVGDVGAGAAEGMMRAYLRSILAKIAGAG